MSCAKVRGWASYAGVTRIMNPQLSEALGLAGVYGAIIRPLLVATILFALWLALARTNLGSRQRLLGWTAVAAVLVLWLTLVWTLALQGRFVPEPGASRILQIAVVLVPMNILITFALTLLTRSQTITAAVDAAPLWWLIAYQMSRVIGGAALVLRLSSRPSLHCTLTGLFAIRRRRRALAGRFVRSTARLCR